MGADKPDLKGKVKIFLTNTENANKELQKLIKEAILESGPTGLFKNRARTDRKAITELRELRSSLLKKRELDFGYHLKELELNFTDKNYSKSLIKIECFHLDFLEAKRYIDDFYEYVDDEGFEEVIHSMFKNLVDWFGEETLDRLIKERKNKFLLPLICPFIKAYDYDLGLRAYNFHEDASPEISVFLKELISQIKPDKILDINFKPRSFSTYSKDIEWEAFCNDTNLCKSSNIFFDSNRISLASFRDNSLIFEQNITKKYDFIIFNPDPKVHTRPIQIQYLIKSKDFLEKDGIIVFCMPSNSIKSNDFLEELNKKDLHISAIFDTDDFFQRTEPDHEAEMNMPILYKCSIVLISKKIKKSSLLANLSNKNTHGNNIAIKNYLKNQVNKNNLSFGTFIDIKNYRGIDFLTSRDKHEKLHKNISGLIPKKISEISNIILDFNDEFVVTETALEPTIKELFFDPSINEKEISSILKTFKNRNELDNSNSIFVSKYHKQKMIYLVLN